MKQGLTKLRLAEILSLKLETTHRESLGYIELLLETMKSTLEAGENLKITGFGNFMVNTKADRKGRNPQTGEEMTIISRRVLTFKPSNILKTNINTK